jgi:hypothetical protein
VDESVPPHSTGRLSRHITALHYATHHYTTLHHTTPHHTHRVHVTPTNCRRHTQPSCRTRTPHRVVALWSGVPLLSPPPLPHKLFIFIPTPTHHPPHTHTHTHTHTCSVNECKPSQAESQPTHPSPNRVSRKQSDSHKSADRHITAQCVDQSTGRHPSPWGPINPFSTRCL